MRYCIINTEGNSRYSDTIEDVLETDRVFEFNEETQIYEEIYLT